MDSSHAQVASEIRILLTFYGSKMTPVSEMRLQELFYVVFGLAHKGFTITPNVNYKCPRSVAAIALPVAAIALPQPPIYLKLT